MKGKRRERKGKGESSADVKQGGLGSPGTAGLQGPSQPHTIPTLDLGSIQSCPGRGTWRLALRICSQDAGEPSLQGRSLQPVSCCCCCGASATNWCESHCQPHGPCSLLLLSSLLPTLAGASAPLSLPSLDPTTIPPGT